MFILSCYPFVWYIFHNPASLTEPFVHFHLFMYTVLFSTLIRLSYFDDKQAWRGDELQLFTYSRTAIAMILIQVYNLDLCATYQTSCIFNIGRFRNIFRKQRNLVCYQILTTNVKTVNFRPFWLFNFLSENSWDQFWCVVVHTGFEILIFFFAKSYLILKAFRL